VAFSAYSAAVLCELRDLRFSIQRAGIWNLIGEPAFPLKQELFGETDRDFFSKVADDVYTFEIDAQGRITAMTLHTDGKDIPLKRID
jgi:hypothetical protein